MWDDDPIAEWDRASVERAVGALIEGKHIIDPEVTPPVTKLRSRNKGLLRTLPGEVPDTLRPNDTIMVTIGLPAYLVIGCSEIGGVEAVARTEIRERLKREGIKWWWPRFLMRSELK